MAKKKPVKKTIKKTIKKSVKKVVKKKIIKPAPKPIPKEILVDSKRITDNEILENFLGGQNKLKL